MSVTIEAIRNALSAVQDPELGRDLVSLGMIQNIAVHEGRVSFRVELTTPACPLRSTIRDNCEQAVRAVPGVTEVQIEMGAKVQASHAPAEEEPLIPEVKNVLLVGSGKGGVGKSTVAVNLALALARAGAKVGLLDTDIYGPSVPTLLGLVGARPEVHPITEHLMPLDYHGLEVMSIGFLTDPDAPLIWRGPMLGGVVLQFLGEVEWGPLDYLVVDLPPGTGDVQLTLAQKLSGAAALLVTTPQEVALADVRRAKVMFEKVGVDVIGLVENMSLFRCPTCGTNHHIFPPRVGAQAASALGLPLLAHLPIDPAVAAGGDDGQPAVTPSGEELPDVGVPFVELAGKVAASLSKRAQGR